MKLARNDRNNPFGGKYAIIRLSELIRVRGTDSPEAMAICDLASKGLVEFSRPQTKDEFFVVKLKDRFAKAALEAYANAAEADDPEYAAEVRELAGRAGPKHPNVKIPD